jgi:hypothetical protein
LPVTVRCCANACVATRHNAITSDSTRLFICRLTGFGGLDGIFAH